MNYYEHSTDSPITIIENLLTYLQEVSRAIVEVVGAGQGVRTGHHLGGAAILGDAGDDGSSS